MKNDFDMIVHQLDNKHDITIYAISDVHLGSLEHNSEAWEKFVETVRNEPNSYIILAGDLMNNATRSSVSNIFEETMSPSAQKRKLVQYLSPLKDKILCGVPGNHERRSLKDADDDPMYDVMSKLDLEDVYRQNIAFMKIQLGKPHAKGTGRNTTYMFAVTHGAGGGIYTGAAVNRNERFGNIIDGLDVLIVGHTHKGVISKPSKIVIDPRNNTVTQKSYVVMSSQSWMSYGGYAVQKMLLPASAADGSNGQKIILSKKYKNIKTEW